MSSAFNNQRPWQRLRSKLAPSLILDNVAGAFLRAPIAASMFTVFFIAAVTFGAAGYRSVFQFPSWIAVPVAMTAILIQIGAKHLISLRSLPGLAMAGLFAALFALNVCFVTAGILAQSPDRFGAAVASSRTASQVHSAERSVAQLVDFGQRIQALSDTSMRLSLEETGSDRPYRATCPASGGPGAGPIHDLRVQDARLLEDMATRTNSSAKQASEALGQIRATLAGYSADEHEDAMTKLKNHTDTIRTALAAAGVDATIQQLKLRRAQIDQGLPVGRYGLVHCPDAELASLIDGVVTIENGSGVRVERKAPPQLAEFVPSPVPDEREIFVGLISEIGKWLNEQPTDFGPYQSGMFGGPFIDIVLFATLAILQAKLRRRKSLEQALYDSLDPDRDPNELRRARALAHRLVEYRMVQDHIRRVPGIATVDILILSDGATDEELYGRATDWARLGLLSEGRVVDLADVPAGHDGTSVPSDGRVTCFTVLSNDFLDHLIDDLTIRLLNEQTNEADRSVPPASNDAGKFKTTGEAN